MELPQPPQDEDLRNIIEKLAVFVARNGQEFESMTKQKQRANPRFAFLYGGEFYNYYMYRVTTEQAVLKHRASRQEQMQQQQQQAMGEQNNLNMNNSNMSQNFGNNFGPPPGMQQQQQRFPPQLQQQMSMFEQNQRGGQMQNFERRFDQQRSPMQMQNFDRPGGGMQNQNFERPPMQNFERPPMQNFQQQQNFDRPPGGPGGNFRGPGPNNFEQRSHGGSGPNFEFERASSAGPNLNFNDRGPGSGGQNFDRGPPPGSNFERPGPGPGIGGGPGPGPGPGIGGGPGPGSGPGLASGPGPGINAGPGPNFPQNFSQNQPAPAPIVTVNIETLKAQKLALEEQIRQSEQNLTGQQQVLMAQQQQQIEESIRIAQDTEIKQLSTELSVNMDEFEAVLAPIVESCTKDAISSGKAWIFTHTSTQRHYHLVTSYLLRKTTDPESSFNKRLHIIYLVNDVLHHCMRKGAEDLQQALESMVIPMFCYSKVAECGKEENLAKLSKLFSLWESKSNYVSPSAVEKLRNFNQTWLEYQGELVKRHAVVVSQIATNIQQTYDGYQNQHQIFCQHVVQSIKSMEQQIQQAILQQQLQLQQQQQQQQQQQLQQQQMSLRNQLPMMTGPPGMANMSSPGPISQNLGHGSQGLPPTNVSQLMTGYPGQGQVPIPGQPFIPHAGQGPPGVEPGGNVPIPDISRPPPGFPTPPPEKDLMPALPFYELPAGLMVPLVKLEDDNYKPIDPKAIRLPPPCPPSERLIQAVEAFYGPPSHDRPRDSEGWERLGLYEYFKSKNLARKQKEDDIREGRSAKSRSPSPIRRDSSPGAGRSPPRRRYQSKSPTPPKRRRSRSRSPSRRRKNNRRSRSRSRSPGRRSPTPPSFSSPGLGIERKLDESNKGHQLLKKMGWGGSGLGANEQGIEAPISGGELREKKDQYRGVGISVNDPFESYRKSKGQAFVERMRQRAEERL